MTLRLAVLVAAFSIVAPSCALGLRGTEGKLVDDPPPTGDEVILEQSDAPIESSGVAEVVAETLPSVVNVKVVGLDESFGGDETRAQGSGVIIDEAGYIVTNNHVIEGAAEVEVVFTDESLAERKTDGVVIGTDTDKDLAVIKVEVDGLDAITLGSEDDLRLGDEVIALGFPLGLGGATVTKGIVSATERDIFVGGGRGGRDILEGVLQTDAAINPGNSGGALVDSAGRLVGINTAAAAAAAAENVGFAISIDTALPVVRDIIENPPDRRPWLGVNIADPTDPLLEEEFDRVAEGTEGAGLVEIFPDGPAEEAGLEPGEVITELEGEAVESPTDLTDALAELSPGDRVTLTLEGPTGEREVTVELDERPVTLGD